jgi:hypothetical protein
MVCPPYWSVRSSASYNSGLSLRRMIYWFVCIGVLIIFLIFIHVFFSFYNYTAIIVLKFPYFSYVLIIQSTAPSRTVETQGFFEFRCIPAMFSVFVSPRFGISDTGGIQPWGDIWDRDQRNKYLFWGGGHSEWGHYDDQRHHLPFQYLICWDLLRTLQNWILSSFQRSS